MASARALANQRLYFARILLDAWREQDEASQVPRAILDRAFGEAVRGHLGAAYGWFLLALLQPSSLPATPPRDTAALPPPPPGIALPGEIREFQHLEQGGWLASLLALSGAADSAATARPLGSLAANTEHPFERQVMDEWHARLGALFERMSQSLDEC
jgi:hypothetical protein